MACDYHGVSKENSIKDVLIQLDDARSKTFRADDFGFCDGKDGAALLTALQRNTWFNTIDIQDTKLRADVCDELALVAYRSFTIRTINLVNIGAKPEFFLRCCDNITRNPFVALTALNLSNNVLEDKVPKTSIIVILAPLSVLEPSSRSD